MTSTPPPPATPTPATAPEPAAGATPTGAPAPRPGLGLSIAGLVLAVVLAPVGLIVSIVALIRARSRGGLPRTLAIIGTIAGALFSIGAAIGLAVAIPLFLSVGQTAQGAQACSDFANGGYLPMQTTAELAAGHVRGDTPPPPSGPTGASVVRAEVAELEASTAGAPAEFTATLAPWLDRAESLAAALDEDSVAKLLPQATALVDETNATYERVDAYCSGLAGSE